ncbi:MAG: DUF3644 domain-containing protein [Bacteroidota bacterium]
MKRRPPITKSLVKNSKAAIFAAIEIHNKPIFPYRYEVVVLLFINAWELLLKAYIYKFQRNVRLFDKEGKSKPFLECVRCVVSNLNKSYRVLEENLINIYNYRNEIAHFHTEDLVLIIFSLLCKNLFIYKRFIGKHFNINLASESDLILLPIGFKKPFSPIDFLSNESYINESSGYVKKFIGDIIESTVKLSADGIQESILVEYSMNVINEKRTKNADIIAGINNEKNTGINIIVKNIIKQATLSDKENATLVKSISFTVPPKTESEEIASWIALKSKDPKFLPSDEEIWRIYSIRKKLVLQNSHRLEIVRISILKNIPVFFWIKSMKQEDIKPFLTETFNITRSFQVKTNIFHISAFLGKSFYHKIYSMFTENMRGRLNPYSIKYPIGGPRSLFHEKIIESNRRLEKEKSEEQFRLQIEEELTSIADKFSKENPDINDKFYAICYDCYLYAQDDDYK